RPRVKELSLRRQNNVGIIRLDGLCRTDRQQVAGDRRPDLIHVATAENGELYSVDAFVELPRNAKTHVCRGRHPNPACKPDSFHPYVQPRLCWIVVSTRNTESALHQTTDQHTYTSADLSLQLNAALM